MDAARVTARCHVIKCRQWSGTQPANEPGLPFYLFGDQGPTAGYGIPLPSALSTRQLLPYGRWKLHLEVWASELLAWCYRHSALDPDLLTEGPASPQSNGLAGRPISRCERRIYHANRRQRTVDAACSGGRHSYRR